MTAFADYLYQNFQKERANTEQILETPTTDILFLVRHHTRKILNPEEVLEIVTQVFIDMKGFKPIISVVSLETHTIGDVIEAIRHTKLLIGMHGAALILSHQLQPGSGLLELFPFALNPENYQLFRATVGLSHNVMYSSWRNTFRNFSFPSQRNLDAGLVRNFIFRNCIE